MFPAAVEVEEALVRPQPAVAAGGVVVAGGNTPSTYILESSDNFLT
jgi:hypothetical protein